MEKANITFIKSAVLALFLSIVLTACGGGGGGGVTAGASGTGASGTGASGTGVVGAGTAAVTPSILSGIAATGAAIQGTVYLKDSAGTVKSQVIASDGSYSFDVTGLTPPFYLRAISNDSNIAPMHSVAMAPGRANINPITNVAVAAAARTADPGASYDNPATHPITQNSIETAIADIRRILDVVTRNERYNDSTAAAINQAMNINPLSDPFEA
ncbi:hypothetical protein H8E50_10885, partial [bacterium]|nr:hypothetical protein [bacterium]